MEKIWLKVKSSIKKQIPAHSYRMWIDPLEYQSADNGLVALTCPNLFSKKRVHDHYLALIKNGLKDLSRANLKVRIEIADAKDAKKAPPKETQLDIPHIHPQNGYFLRKGFTFDEFVVSGSNDFAYSASLALASRKCLSQNFLFLLSKTGLGKSHLSQAIGHHILAQSPSERVYYTTADDFSNEMVSAFRSNSINAFKKKYRNGCDVLLLEDVHYLSGKERTQTELALILDALRDVGKKIIFSSCYPPSDIPKLTDILRSRLANGIVSSIEPPNFRTRTRILKKKLSGHDSGVRRVPEDVIRYLAGELTEDVRQLESGLAGVLTKSSLLGSPMDMKLAESVVKTIAKKKKKITADAIKKLVCRHYRLTQEDIVSKSRKRSIVRPRQIAMYLSRKYTDLPLQTIGKKYNRYHATALHSINAIEQAVKTGGALGSQVRFLCEKLESGDLA
ncbi:Chromosomal replication initiator protein DnaA [Candidatus Desulfarcum epimagneticum]|uniref:Chromosomal replication initiator protein DnaA n=1 Tax=uncultured Desulfobacteraceae bacterium TaxID=218296 RepID=A0A484HEM0_9BACT|nr:Chromosomal replication initiator protein DnaA [uncultured Desulfobacteraceae bacterium]